MENEQLKQEAQKQFPNDSREIHMDGFHNGVEFQKQIDFNTQQYCKREGFVAGASFVSQNRDEEIAEFTDWCTANYYKTVQNNKWVHRTSNDASPRSTKQLFDLFINSKNKK